MTIEPISTTKLAQTNHLGDDVEARVARYAPGPDNTGGMFLEVAQWEPDERHWEQPAYTEEVETVAEARELLASLDADEIL